MDAMLEGLARLLREQAFLGPLLALLAGMITSVLPCSLSSIPLIIAAVGGTENRSPKRSFFLSLLYGIGLAITYTLLGAIAAQLGGSFIHGNRIFFFVIGVLMILMSFQTMGLFTLIPSSYLTGRSRKRGAIGAVIAGILGGLFASPCSTPVLVVLLSLVAGQGNLLYGILLLFFYSLGSMALVLVIGTSMGVVGKMKQSPKYAAFNRIVSIVLGILMIVLGLYFFYQAI